MRQARTLTLCHLLYVHTYCTWAPRACSPSYTHTLPCNIIALCNHALTCWGTRAKSPHKFRFLCSSQRNSMECNRSMKLLAKSFYSNQSHTESKAVHLTWQCKHQDHKWSIGNVGNARNSRNGYMVIVDDLHLPQSQLTVCSRKGTNVHTENVILKVQISPSA